MSKHNGIAVAICAVCKCIQECKYAFPMLHLWLYVTESLLVCLQLRKVEKLFFSTFCRIFTPRRRSMQLSMKINVIIHDILTTVGWLCVCNEETVGGCVYVIEKLWLDVCLCVNIMGRYIDRKIYTAPVVSLRWALG